MNEEIYCPNCGALIPADAVICPYCQFENEDLARKAEEAGINELVQKHNDEVQKLPKKLVKKNTKLLFAVIVVLVLSVICVIYMFNKADRQIKESMYDRQEAHIAKLEEYYQAGDYKKMTDTLYEIKSWGGSFGKYSNTAEVYVDCHYSVEALEFAAEADGYTNARREEELKEALRESIWALIHAQEFRDKGFIYGEGEAVDKLSGEVYDTLKNVWGITEQELEDAKEMYVDRNTDYSELAHILVERKMGNR